MATSRTRAGRPPFERIALLLQGGGALGAYQAGVYEGLAERNLHPDWVAGISIGAINASLIAGNPPEHRVSRLRQFWERITESPFGVPGMPKLAPQGDIGHIVAGQVGAAGALLGGAPGFFKPRLPPPFLQPRGSVAALSYYDVGPLRETLEHLVDFRLLNNGTTRLSVGAVNVRTGNFIYFDNTERVIGPEHIMASGSLPPGFPPQEIEGDHYWDGGLVSNTPLQFVLDTKPRQDTLAFQVDLWNARGELPKDLLEQETRQKEIRFSSRTRLGTDHFRESQHLRRSIHRLLHKLPPAVRRAEEAALLEPHACEKVFNIVHLIYRARDYEGLSKDFEFSRRTMEEHWQAGLDDARRTLRHPQVLQRPKEADAVTVFDFTHQERE